MAVWVSKIRIRGIRGFNDESVLDLVPGLNLLIGKNGAGKTSFLQAIEWCLTGKMKYMDGDEFSREDAIVNLFNPSASGRVVLTLQTSKGEVEVSRTRKRGKSTTRGSSPLLVRMGSKVLEDEDAEAHLEKTLGLPIDEISNSIYLHQAALRAILSDDPKERSRSIDKMLGMEEIRSFAEALSTKRNMTVAIKALQTRIETLNREKVAFAVMTRERVDKDRKTLIEKGHSEDDLDLVNQQATASAIVTKAESLKTKLGYPGAIPKQPRADVVSLGEFLDEISEVLLSIDRRRAEALQSVYKDKVKLESLRDQLRQASEEVRILNEKAGSNLELARNLSAEELSLAHSVAERTKAFSALNPIVSTLIRVHDRIESIRSSEAGLQSNISKIEQAVGTEETHEALIGENKHELASIDQKLESLGSLEKLLDSALDYLLENKPTKCPVCEQAISPEDVIDRVRSGMSQTVGQEIASVKANKKTTSTQIHSLETSLKELKGLHIRLNEEKNREIAALQEAETETGIKLQNDLASQLQSNKNELQAIENEVSQIRNKLNQTSSRLREVKSELDRLDNAKIRLQAGVTLAQKALNSQSEENKLIDEFKTKIMETEQLENEFKNTDELDSIKKSLDNLGELNEFSKSEVELDRIEKEVPKATVLIDSLQTRLTTLRDFEASLVAIKEVLGGHEQKVASGVIRSLENSFNRYFQSLDPHEHFKKVQVEVEEAQPPLYSIRAIGKEQSTFITTRFSSAQMNAAAIALFLAKCEKVSGELGSVLLDDPTQSMDESHKVAVCKSVTSLLKDKQVILATQDQEIVRLMKDAQKGAKMLEFSEWTVNGPVIG
jgi:exonuclease SbcC